MTLLSGTRLGPYEIGSPLGAGGMGEVYRARDTRLGRDVAIKVVPADFATDRDRLRRFEQEARAAAALNHPNILVLHDVGRYGGQPYLVTELLEGETLKEQIGRGGLTVSRSIDFGIQIARGLAAAHEKGIVHRDLKPGNVFVTADGTVKILDFSLAKLLESEGPLEVLRDASTRDPQTATGARLGTVGYMAPEQVRGLAVDHRADIFAFGCVLYEMLSGRRAFTGDTEADTISAILTKDPPPLSSSMQALPTGLERIVRRCLEKRPDDRFSSARASDSRFRPWPRLSRGGGEKPRRSAVPGLAAFTGRMPSGSGRDEEIAALWRKIPERTLLALIGPSGAGKTSYLQRHRPEGSARLAVSRGLAQSGAVCRPCESLRAPVCRRHRDDEPALPDP
jgi:serine/threonine protein kinase